MTTQASYQSDRFALPVTPSSSDPISLKVTSSTNDTVPTSRDRQRSGTITSDTIGRNGPHPLDSPQRSSSDPTNPNPMYPSGAIQKPRPVSTSSSGSGGSGSNKSLMTNPLAQINSNNSGSPFGDSSRVQDSLVGDDAHVKGDFEGAGKGEISDKARGKQRAWEVDFGSGYDDTYKSAAGEERDDGDGPLYPFRAQGGNTMNGGHPDQKHPARTRSGGSSFSTVNGNEHGRDRSGTVLAGNGQSHGDWQRVGEDAEEESYKRDDSYGHYGHNHGDGDLGSRSGVREPTIRAISQEGANGQEPQARRMKPSEKIDMDSLEEIRAERKRSVKYNGGRPTGGSRVHSETSSVRYGGGGLREDGRRHESGASGWQDLEKGVSGGEVEVQQYPPISEAESEEKAIQENLARLAARDLARRRAARTSRMYNSGSQPLPASSPSSSGFSNGPSGSTGFSNSIMTGVNGHGGMGSNAGKRNTLLGGLLGRLGSYGSAGQRESLGSVDEEMGRRKRDSEIPLAAHSASFASTDPASISRPSSTSPFDGNPLTLTRSTTPTTPTYEYPNKQQPGIDSMTKATPVMRPSGLPVVGNSTQSNAPLPDFGSSMLSAGRNPFGTSSSHGSYDHDSEERQSGDAQRKKSWDSGTTAGGGVGSAEPGWKGSAWRGGAGELHGRRGSIGYAQQVDQKQEKWWSALCAWGNDLDEGQENAGRTNPFE